MSKVLLDFEKWLIAGYGAIFAFTVSKLVELSSVVAIGNLKCALGVLAAALVLSIFVLFIGGQVLASLAAGEEIRKAVPDLLAKAERQVDLPTVNALTRQGLWWPASAGSRWGARKIEAGDWTASARLVAKLSQVQTYLVMGQVLLGLVAAALVLCGIKV